MNEFKEGQKVHYIPYEGCFMSEYQNGIIKSFTNNMAGVFVVYNCDNDWKNYKDYTATLYPICEIKNGWIH